MGGQYICEKTSTAPKPPVNRPGNPRCPKPVQFPRAGADVHIVKLSILSSRTPRWNTLLLRAFPALFLSASLAVAAPVVPDAPPKDEKFPTLTIGSVTFTNVTVLTKTKADVFISHSSGMASLKVKELDTETQLKLGYQVASPRPKPAEAFKKLTTLTREVEADPRIQAAEELAAERFLLAEEQYGDRLAYGFIAALILSYLSFSSMCRSICVKVASAPKDLLPLVWLPLFKQLPLLKAAGMSPLWFLTSFIPGAFLITYVVWGFKISRARGKNPAVGILFLLPVLNILAFLYLAASSGVAGSASSGGRNVIALQSSPKREAA